MASGASAFEFAFNNKAFSDRVLLLELDASSSGIEEDLQEEATGLPEATGAHNDTAPRRRRKRKGRDETEASATNDERIIEEDAFVDAIRFIFCGHVASKSVIELIRLILVADRFEIPSCVQGACDALAGGVLQAQKGSPWGVVKCLLALPDSVRTHKTVSELLVKAQKLMSEYYKDFQARAAAPGGLSELSEAGLQMVLASDDLEVESEADVFDAVCAWVRARFKDADTRAAAMAQLAPFVRFAWIPPEKLEEYFKSDEMQSDACQKLLTEALLFRCSPKDARARLVERAHDDRRFIRRGSTLAVEHLPARICWDDSAAFFVELPEDSLPAHRSGASVFTEELFFEGQPYQVEFLRSIGQTLGAFLHVLKKVPRSQLPTMKIECLHGFPGVDPQWSLASCTPPAFGSANRYGSDDILQTIGWRFNSIAWRFGSGGWQIFRGEGRDKVASIRIALSRNG
ncbi:BTB/POZ/Kelch-associated protein [Klebsormidium nitens]|uniref:BTB/POZ/Kelch-associated protein n=1 Tax=Klebsormidium nitens TaxID=105231 RepID=A0A1Y1HN12_KLENI|nr:BTB/POZ/Kelch-associated protein [Klebsormidium nitens]|eukprot:GAQ80020.1 BTB/POZ/Kelch-associated protein [Klebsormidium nitens]